MIVPVLQGFSTQNLDMIPAICKLNHRLLMHSIVRNQIFHLFRRKLFQYWPCKKHQHILSDTPQNKKLAEHLKTVGYITSREEKAKGLLILIRGEKKVKRFLKYVSNR